MFRVPSDPQNPTKDDTFKVSFFQWLTSKKPERKEWQRRLNAAEKVTERNRLAAVRQAYHLKPRP